MLASSGLVGQDYIFDIQHLTTEDGLANLRTTAVHRDQQGFLWISTAYGLNKYDGYQFKLYDTANSGLQSSNEIRYIQEDERGNLWLHYLSTKNHRRISAIDVFNPRTEKAMPLEVYLKTPIPFDIKDLVRHHTTDPKHRQWFSTINGEIFLYENGKFEKIFEQKNALFYNITVDEQDLIWLATDCELLNINLQGEVLETESFPHPIYRIWNVKPDSIQIATLHRNFLTLVPNVSNYQLSVWTKPRNGKALPFQFQKNGEKFSSFEGQNCFIHLHQTGYWVLNIDKDLHLFDSSGSWLYDYAESSLNKLITGFRFPLDVGNDVWLSSVTGLYKVSYTANPFQLIHKKEGYSNCRGIAEDEKGMIYFLNDYIYQWHPQQQVCEQLPIQFRCTNVLNYHDNRLWAGLYSNSSFLFEYNLATKQYQYFDYLNSNPVYTLLKMKTAHQYLFSRAEGLILFDTLKKTALPFQQYNDFKRLETSLVNHIYRNKTGIWLATENGLFFMTEEDGVLREFSLATGDLPFDHIRHIHEDVNGVFWLATKGGGVIRWENPLQHDVPSETIRLTTNNGLADDFIYAIYEDEEGKLWMSSDKGLMCIEKETLRVKNFSKNDGLPHPEFNMTSHYQAKDGTLYFGGLGGLISFHPKAIEVKFSTQVPIKLTDTYILEGEAIDVSNKTAQLEREKELRIHPSDKFLELHFTLLDFDKPSMHQYTYQIEGYSNKWNLIDENYIRITSLPYGDYTLNIRGKNKLAGWSEDTLSIPLQVLRPFYLQYWFILSLLMVTIGLAVLFFKWRIRQVENEKVLLEAEVKKRTAKIAQDKAVIEKQAVDLQLLDKAKTRFFANITHEFRTPLTLISGPLEQVCKEPLSDSIRSKLSIALKNSHQLKRLINQLLDLSKIEGGGMKVEVSHGNLIAYTKELVNRFRLLADKKGQRISFLSQGDTWEIHFDQNKWNKIIYNLLSNAIKFTPQNGVIQLSLFPYQKQEKKWILLEVKDTGIGIEQKHLDKVFNRFQQVDDSMTRMQEGTGIGLSLVKELAELQGGQVTVRSKINIGSIFQVKLPILTVREHTDKVNFKSIEKLSIPSISLEETTSSSLILPNSKKKEKLKLLLIEDNAEMRKYILSCLDASIYHITEACDGEEGVQKAFEIIPDLIISDIMMPKKDGFQVVQTIRSHMPTSHIPIVLLTAKTALQSRLEGFQLGADAYLTKPFSPTELAVRIQKLIEMRHFLQKRFSHHIFKPEPIPVPTSNLPSSISIEKEDQFITELKTIIFENITLSELNGDFIGKKIGMSRMQLHRKIKALTNQSITKFIQEIRLQQAYELLKTSKAGVSEIAYQTGFASPGHFSKTFKKRFEITPSALSKKNIK